MCVRVWVAQGSACSSMRLHGRPALAEQCSSPLTAALHFDRGCTCQRRTPTGDAMQGVGSEHRVEEVEGLAVGQHRRLHAGIHALETPLVVAYSSYSRMPTSVCRCCCNCPSLQATPQQPASARSSRRKHSRQAGRKHPRAARRLSCCTTGGARWGAAACCSPSTAPCWPRAPPG